jgi:Amino acid transporters
MSGELRQPRRAIPLGTLAAVAVGFLVYAALPVWLAHHVPAETLRHDSRVLWDISAIPTLVYLGVWGATLSSAIGSVLTAPRTLQALARDGLMPRVFAQMSGDPPEPRAGLVCTFVLAEAGILLGSLDAIAPVLTMFFLATYGMTNLALGSSAGRAARASGRRSPYPPGSASAAPWRASTR